MTIFANIAARRQSMLATGEPADWTQAACAKRAVMSQSQWADIERGRRMPRLDTLDRVAAALGCTAAELITGA